MNTEIKEQAKNRLEEYLSFKGINTRKPFNCLNPEHADHTPSMSLDPHNKQYCKCFACGVRYDIFDVIAAEYNIPPQSAQAFKKTYEVLGINTPSEPRKEGKNTTQQEIQQITPTQEQNAVEVNTADYTAYYKNCMQNLKNSKAAAEYLNSRGISVETALKYGVGFDEQADPAQSNHPTARIIIPVSKSFYIGRAISENAGLKKTNNKGGKADIFNRKIIDNADFVFIVEGAMDALSLIEVNAAAIALNSKSYVNILLKILEEQGSTKTTYIIALDNDNAGRTATEQLEKGLQALNIDYIIADVCGEYKDPNEYLTADKEHFILSVSEALTKASSKPDNIESYINYKAFKELQEFRKYNTIKTGFKYLDELSNGIYSGLYVVAAVSSLGKTTFCTQMADQIAEQGNDVIFFSLEQSKLELFTKSISRRMAIYDKNEAVSAINIRSKEQLPKRVYETIADYQNAIQDRLSIKECNFDFDVVKLREYVERYIRKTGKRPVVFVDYLQLLQPPVMQGKRPTIKEAMDIVVSELKRISRDNHITIFAISSVNRANYKTSMSFESLKESGGIEYTADVIFGLQLQMLQVSHSEETLQEEKKRKPRRIELVCLKNRYGISNYNTYFDYYSEFDYFINNEDIDKDIARIMRASEKKEGK